MGLLLTDTRPWEDGGRGLLSSDSGGLRTDPSVGFKKSPESTVLPFVILLDSGDF